MLIHVINMDCTSEEKARSEEFRLTLSRLFHPTETTPATCFTLCGDDQLYLDGDIRNTVTGDGK
jgi:hypothetical protein